MAVLVAAAVCWVEFIGCGAWTNTDLNPDFLAFFSGVQKLTFGKLVLGTLPRFRLAFICVSRASWLSDLSLFVSLPSLGDKLSPSRGDLMGLSPDLRFSCSSSLTDFFFLTGLGCF